MTVPLSLVAALKGCSNAGGVSSIPKKFFIAESPTNQSLNVLVQETLPFVFLKELVYHNRKAVNL